MKQDRNRGFTLVEAIASVFIITFVFITAFSIIVNIRKQTLANNAKINAIETATAIRDELKNTSDYLSLAGWLDGQSKTITADNCSLVENLLACNLFDREPGELEFALKTTIVFDAPDPTSEAYQVISFSVIVVYYQERTIEIRGMIYE